MRVRQLRTPAGGASGGFNAEPYVRTGKFVKILGL
jgi:hypothetical protein